MKIYVYRGIILLLTLFALIMVLVALAPAAATKPVIYNTPRAVKYFNEDLIYSETNTSSDCLIQIEQCKKYIGLLSMNTNHSTSLSLKKKANQEIVRVNTIINLYIQDYEKLLAKEVEEAKWKDKMDKYPEATKIWRYMKDNFNWSDETCAGVLGNMMAEVGGGTLNLSNWDANGSSGYGLIQWMGGRRSSLEKRYGKRPTIEEQLLYMYDELYGLNDTRKQVSNKVLKEIVEGDSAGDIAYIFAKYYERCHRDYVNIRIGYAEKAYKYFVD